MATPKRRLPHANTDPPKEYCAPMGDVVLRWSRLEYQLGVINRVISKLGKVDQRRLVINQRTANLCRMLRVLAPGVPSVQLSAELLQFADDVEKGCGKRDDYVHSIYGHWLDDPGTPMKFRLRSGMPALPVSTQEIESFVSEVKGLQVRAQELTTQLKAIFGTKP